MRHTLIDGKAISCEYSGGFDYDCGLLVIGLGTAGVLAAISAAKSGTDVIGVDLAPLPGGVGTAACVWDYYFGANGGLYEEVNAIADTIVAQGNYLHSTKPDYKASYTTPVKALALERELNKYGVRGFYSCSVTDIFTKDGSVCGAAFHDGERVFTVGAKLIVDGAEGVVCRLLGLKNLGGRKSDNRTARFSRTVGVLENGLMHGAWTFNEQFSGLSAEECARSIFKWSAMPPCLPDVFNEKSRLYALGCETGKREVFCSECEDVYTFADYLDGRKRENVLFYAFSPLDNSNPDMWNEDVDFQDWSTLCGMHAYGVSVGVTPGMMIAKGIGGLLVAGKHIGTGHTMTSCVRMRTDLEKCGEAVGVMATMAIEKGCTPSEVGAVHFDELRAKLESSGCYNPENDRGIGDLNVPERGMVRSAKLPETVDELRETLASIHPSLGLIAVRLGLIDATESLLSWLDSDERLLGENAAVALGLLGDRRALAKLREILAGEVEFHVYNSPNRWFFPWLCTTELCNFVKAAVLVSRFNSDEDRKLIESLAAYVGNDPRRIKAANYAKVALEK